MRSYAEARLAELDVKKPATTRRHRSAVSNGKLLPAIDGRSAPARRMRDIGNAIVSDLGGADQVPQVMVSNISVYAANMTMAESIVARWCLGEKIDMDEWAIVCSILIRLGRDIGAARIPRDVVTLDQYLSGLQKKQNGHEDQASADEPTS